ncbi:hypothetical protein UlMin_017628 [Ulmus minor]
MSQQGNSSCQSLEVKVNMSPPPPRRASHHQELGEDTTTASESSLSSEMSVDGSCVSSEAEETSNSLDNTAMVLVGCPRCLMYVMLSDVDPKCPKCKSTVLLDFLNHATNKKTGT